MKKLNFIVLSGLAAIAVACGSLFAFLNKDTVGKVNKIVIAVTDSNKYPNYNSTELERNEKKPGGLNIGTVASAVTKALSKDNQKLADELVVYVRDKIAAELSQVPGWQVISFNEAKKTQAYKTYLANVDKFIKDNRIGPARAAVEAANDTIIPPGMPKVRTGRVVSSSGYQDIAANLAKEIGASAYMYIGVDLGYQTVNSIGGVAVQLGKADVSVSLAIYTANKEWVIFKPLRASSDDKTPLINKSLIYTNKTIPLYKNAADKVARQFRDKIIENLPKKS